MAMPKTRLTLLIVTLLCQTAWGAGRLDRYYAHETVEDAHGVIAPWFTGLNGLLDYRVRVSMETLKRYPWADTKQAVMPAPHFVYTSAWSIDADGNIGVPPLNDWMCGDLGQRTVSIINGMADYYRYSGDPAAIGFIVMQADYILAHALTPAGHPWPSFPISVPTKGKPYGTCDPTGMIQLDLSADIGTAILRAYQITGDSRYFDAAKGWGDLLASHANLEPGKPTWNRYANPESSKWSNELTGSETLILRFLDMLIRLGHTGQDGAVVKARDAGRAWLNNTLLDQWAKQDTWGRYYWDWECPVYCIAGVWAAQYVLDNRDAFPSWKTDARNVLTLMINRTCVFVPSTGDTYSGAWAVPESPSCCGNSLSYGQQILAAGLAQYSVLAGDPLTREMARRMAIMGAYDALDNGTVIDGLDGKPVVASAWLNIIHPLALRFTLQSMSWLPELFGPARENHVMRTSGEVVSVTYAKRKVSYKTFDAPANSVDTLRLALAPATVTADGNALERRTDLAQNGYVITQLANGDCMLSVRHDGATSVVVEGADPQQDADVFTGEEPPSFGFTGNQFRIIGDAGPSGGLADVYVDGIKQRAGIDCWSPDWRDEQVLFSKSGLQNAHHEMRVVVRNEKNFKSDGASVRLRTVQYSDAGGENGYGSGAMAPAVQRMVFGYTGRANLRDAKGNEWKPATEWFTRLTPNADSVAETWWSTPAEGEIGGTDSPDLYRYGGHAAAFTVNVTVGPGQHYAILKFAATRGIDTAKSLVTVFVNGDKVLDKLDVAAKAGGQSKALDLEFHNLKPKNGIIELKFEGSDNAAGSTGEAFIQAIEVGPEPHA